MEMIESKQVLFAELSSAPFSICIEGTERFFAFGGDDNSHIAKTRIVNGVAIVPMHGPMFSKRYPILDKWGIAHVGNSDLRRELKALAENPTVKSIHIDADTPGGTVAGLPELADTIREIVSSGKPVTAHTNGILASAGVFACSGCTRITASKSAMVGSLGTVTSIEDLSGYFERIGIKVHVVSTGPIKGMGTFGAPVTEAHLNYLQEMVNEFGEQFKSYLMSGRNLTKLEVEAIFTGAMFSSAKAQQFKLIDGIVSEERAVPTQEVKMSDEKLNELLAAVTSVAGTVAQLATAVTEQGKKINDIQNEKPKAEKASIIRKAQEAGKIAPAALATLEKLTAGMDAAEVQAFVDGLGPMVHTSTETVITERDDTTVVKADEITQLNKIGVSLATYRQFGEVAEYSHVTRELKTDSNKRFKVKAGDEKMPDLYGTYYGNNCRNVEDKEVSLTEVK